MALEGIPAGILSKHPELVQAMEALDAYDQGHPVTTRCGECGELLMVTEVKETGEVWVMCGTKTLYREHRTPVSATLGGSYDRTPGLSQSSAVKQYDQTAALDPT